MAYVGRPHAIVAPHNVVNVTKTSFINSLANCIIDVLSLFVEYAVSGLFVFYEESIKLMSPQMFLT